MKYKIHARVSFVSLLRKIKEKRFGIYFVELEKDSKVFERQKRRNGKVKQMWE